MNLGEQEALVEMAELVGSDSVSGAKKPGRHARNHSNRNGSLPARILVVEDETWIAIELQHALASGGYDVVGLAADADTAVRLAGERKPSLVLMDIHLAGRGDGIDAASRIRDRFGVRSVFLSGHLDASTRHRLAAVHPAAVLDKPVSPTELLRTIASALGGEQVR